MIRINCKEGVWFKFISYEFLALARIVFRKYEEYGIVPTVTSAADGVHNSDLTQTLHDDGLAWDWRIWGLPNPKKVWDEIRAEAQAIDYHYDIVFGDEAHLNHAHTEYDINKKEEVKVA